jgi:hypothetical protein
MSTAAFPYPPSSAPIDFLHGCPLFPVKSLFRLSVSIDYCLCFICHRRAPAYLLRASSRVESLLVLDDNTLVSGAGDHKIHLCSLKDFRLLGVLIGHTKNVVALVVSYCAQIKFISMRAYLCNRKSTFQAGPEGRIVFGSYDHTIWSGAAPIACWKSSV